MFSEDYILRMIRMATAALAQIIGLKKAGQYQQALQAIDQALEEVISVLACGGNAPNPCYDDPAHRQLQKN